VPDALASDVLSHCREQWRTDESGQLLVGDMTLREAIELAGGTPAYLYARDLVAGAVRDVRAILGDAELFYSVKANPFQPLLGFVASLVDGFDVASAGELARVVCAGARGDRIQFSGPGKDPAEVRAAVAAGALLNVESARQVQDAAEAATSLGKDARVVLRVNPRSLPGWSGLRMGGGASQFGVDADDVADAVGLCRTHGIEPLGLHFYWGTQCLEGEKVAAAQRHCWQLGRELAESTRLRLLYLNLGGGFGIPYYRGDAPLDLDPVQESVAEVRAELAAVEPAARLVLELGRYLAGPAGVYVTRVLDVKRSGGATIAVTDGGMHQHLAASGNLGQSLRRSFPCYTPMDMWAAAEEEVRVVGRLCTPIDILCPDARLPAIAPGDLVALFQSGAYGASASPQAFLGHEPVTEVLL
jgi:diaminopimelate decarboxylase